MRKTGYYEKYGENHCFIPYPLPPREPLLELDGQTMSLYGEAMLAIGKLNEMIEKVPDTHRFIKAYVFKEALLSSCIEGIHTTLLDVFTQPLLETKADKDTQLVMNYTKALDKAITLVRDDEIPIASRVILAAHKELMQTGQGDKSDPGYYRRVCVRVGKLIPPPPQKIPELMADLESYVNLDTTYPPLIKAGLAHVQFETIHPFMDGNGRIGRLLIVLMLMQNDLLTAPILYPSYYFKKHQLNYYQKLSAVEAHGDFEGWIKFYLTALKESSIDAYKRATDIEILRDELSHLIRSQAPSDRSMQTRLAALSVIFSYPVINATELSIRLQVSYNTANQVILDFVNLKILRQENQKKRHKLYIFKHYLDVLQREYEERG
jgi:Fic family protein